tara:strand:+ start:264 stop:821 length:558 start_codon:yes stop_codon:yes gene_type:complete
MIHKTYSKADLCEIISLYGMNIDNPHLLRKCDLSAKVESYIKTDNPIHFDNSNKLFENITCKSELVELLSNINPYKRLSVKQKNNVMKFCKDMIHYCNHGYVLENTIYKSERDIESYMREIVSYGDIPSVRRVCRLMRDNPHITDKFNPVISVKTRLQLEEKEKSKVRPVNCLIAKQGQFTLSFS